MFVNMKTIQLTDKELKLLMIILEKYENDRLNMNLEKPYYNDNEKNLFTKKERIEMIESLKEKGEFDEMDSPLLEECLKKGVLFHSQYVEYITYKIEKQIK